MSTQRQPKGIPVGGQFAANTHDEAGSSLASASPAFDLERESKSLEHDYAVALRDEKAAHFALAAEQFGDGEVRLEFDDQDGDVVMWTPDGEMIEDDSLVELLPEGFRNGYVAVERGDDGYVVMFEDHDEGLSDTCEFPTHNNDIEALAQSAKLATERRALIRDSAEKVAVIGAFENAAALTGENEVTFIPKSQALIGDGAETNTLQIPGGFSVAPTNARESEAFGFYGQGVKRVRIERTDHGYTIHRTVERPISGGEEVLTDEIAEGSHSRWKSGEL